MTRRPGPPAEATRWRRSSLEVITSEVVAGRQPGPVPPKDWMAHLHQLVEASRLPAQGPAWWTPMNAYFGSVETRTDPESYCWDGTRRLGPRDPPLVFFQFTLAGWGQFEQHGHRPERVPPGSAFFAVVPSRHRYYLPRDSPGWTFGWIGIYHPYLIRRIARQVATTGPLVRMQPASAFTALAMRLVRGAFEKDYRDRFDVELALFEFTVGYERLAQELSDPQGERERMLESLRSRVLATPRQPVSVDAVAAEHGMSRTHFSHFFRNRTDLTPARFMTEVRIQQAARMLVETRSPMKLIASELGFANENHFGKVFRRFHHLSPAAYRRSFT